MHVVALNKKFFFKNPYNIKEIDFLYGSAKSK